MEVSPVDSLWPQLHNTIMAAISVRSRLYILRLLAPLPNKSGLLLTPRWYGEKRSYSYLSKGICMKGNIMDLAGI